MKMEWKVRLWKLMNPDIIQVCRSKAGPVGYLDPYRPLAKPFQPTRCSWCPARIKWAQQGTSSPKTDSNSNSGSGIHHLSISGPGAQLRKTTTLDITDFVENWAHNFSYPQIQQPLEQHQWPHISPFSHPSFMLQLHSRDSSYTPLPTRSTRPSPLLDIPVTHEQ